MRNWTLLVFLVTVVGCKTPDKYFPRDTGAMEEPDGSTLLSPDAAAPRLDVGTSLPLDGAQLPADAAPGADTPIPVDAMTAVDTGPAPCTSGTARCAPSGTAVEMCTSGQWTTRENCPLTCSNAICTSVCTANLPCTQGIGPCRKGATFCATPSSPPGCADVGADDGRGGCSGGNVCKSGACVAACQGGVACTQGIKACRNGATFCATPTSGPVCNDSGADDSKGGCTGVPYRIGTGFPGAVVPICRRGLEPSVRSAGRVDRETRRDEACVAPR